MTKYKGKITKNMENNQIALLAKCIAIEKNSNNLNR